MIRKNLLKIFVLGFSLLYISSPSQAFYKKKVRVGQFENPNRWSKPYQPGAIIVEFLKQKLENIQHIQLLSDSEILTRSVTDEEFGDNHKADPAIFHSGQSGLPGVLPVQGMDSGMKSPAKKSINSKVDMKLRWPAEMGSEPIKASLTKIIGKVVKFLPGSSYSSIPGPQSLENKAAEIEVHVELVQNKTGRILFKKIFSVRSSEGTQPFSLEKLNIESMHGRRELSSINHALNNVTEEIGLFIADKMDSIFLEGEIIGINRIVLTPDIDPNENFQEEILINIGAENGVRVGDEFRVHAMGLGLRDPFTKNDLGDIYVNTGIIQIIRAWEGFSKARPLGGKNFKTGFLVRSKNALGDKNYDFLNNSSTIRKGANQPWWEFPGNFSRSNH